jgi:fructokinase
MATELLGSIEAGGTKFICGVGSGPDDIKSTVRIPTTTPGETLGACVKYFQEQEKELGKIRAVGISAFGPLDLKRSSPTFGSVTKTPKPGWSNTSLIKPITDALKCPVEIDTDVNGAALAEARWGSGKGLSNILYLTVGTGIGGGAIANGELIHGLIHPEMGHIRLVKHPEDTYEGGCPFHKVCFEGLASGPAFKARWGENATKLPMDHKAWAMEADYIAQALVNYICVLSTEKIIIGGGVMHHTGLFPLVRSRVVSLLAGYVDSPAITQNIDTYIVPPGLGDSAGLLGGIALAESVLK